MKSKYRQFTFIICVSTIIYPFKFRLIQLSSKISIENDKRGKEIMFHNMQSKEHNFGEKRLQLMLNKKFRYADVS